MSEHSLNTWDDKIEEARRDFLNAAFGILAGLAIHDIRNASLQRPIKKFQDAFGELMKAYPGRPIELKMAEGLISICGDKVQSHFSIVEAQKVMIEAMDSAMLESICFDPTVTSDDWGVFFSKWSLHRSVQTKPRPITGQFDRITLTFVDPEKLKKKLKSREMLMSPNYALQRFFLLKKQTEEVFKGINSNELKSQKNLKREILEMVEIARLAPYNIVALSLIRPAGAVGQSMATSLLSAVLAHELEFTLREQVNLGMIGLLYNVGIIGEESKLIEKADRLSHVEYKRVLDAQASGVYKLIKMQGSSRPVLERLLAIFEFSKGPDVKSVSLTLESRLLRLVSQYVALTSDRPFRDAYTPQEAIKILGSKAVGQTGAELDPILYYMLVRFLGVYPVGSLVLLSNNEKGIVFRPSGEKLGVPMIKTVPKDPSVPSVLVDLSLEPDLSIVKALDPKREGVNVTGFFFE